jgi:hypothetical protein
LPGRQSPDKRYFVRSSSRGKAHARSDIGAENNQAA